MGPQGDGRPAHADSGSPASPHDEHRVAGSPAAVATNAAVLALTRAARSFTLYDPANKVVRSLIVDFRDKMTRALAAHGAMDLEVRPFELARGGEVVYVDQDRERSLAFRLFRDGVRRLTFAASVTWDELLAVLEIFSVRFSGVRQQEDDLVTLLQKSGFSGISMVAIEGFVPDEELAEPPLPAEVLRRASGRFQSPDAQDVPLPEFGELAALQYRTIDERLLERLRREEEGPSVPAAAAGVVSDLLATCASDAQREAVRAFAVEIRDFLVLEGGAAALGDLARALKATGGAPEDFVGESVARALLAGETGTDAAPSAALVEILDMAPGGALEPALEMLSADPSGPRAPLLRAIVARAARGRGEALATRLSTADGASAATLFDLLAVVDPGRATHAAAALVRRGGPELQARVLQWLEATPFDAEIGRTLMALLEADPAVRVRAAATLAARGGTRAFHALQVHLEKHAAHASEAEARGFGHALARAAADRALALFAIWLEPQAAGGLIGRIVHVGTARSLQLAALAGLQAIDGSGAERLLALLASKGDADVRQAAAETLARRSRGPSR